MPQLKFETLRSKVEATSPENRNIFLSQTFFHYQLWSEKEKEKEEEG